MIKKLFFTAIVLHSVSLLSADLYNQGFSDEALAMQYDYEQAEIQQAENAKLCQLLGGMTISNVSSNKALPADSSTSLSSKNKGVHVPKILDGKVKKKDQQPQGKSKACVSLVDNLKNLKISRL